MWAEGDGAHAAFKNEQRNFLPVMLLARRAEWVAVVIRIGRERWRIRRL